MKVILADDVPNLGAVGETVKVADGYARNYLLPRKLAVRIDSGSAKQIEHERRRIAVIEEKRRSELTKVARAIENVTLNFEVRAGVEGKIFGSVTTANIAEKLGELGYTVDRKAVQLPEPIKSLGIEVVPVRLASGIEANVKVWVQSIEGEELEAAQPADETAPADDAAAPEPEAEPL